MGTKAGFSGKPDSVPELNCIAAGIWLAALIIIAFLTRLRLGYHGVPSFDGCGYIMHAWNLAQGKLTTAYWAKGVDHYYQPLYPFLILSFHRFFKDWVTAANVSNHILGAALLIPFYFLGRRIYGRVGGIFTAALLVSYPILVELSSGPSSEPAFVLLFGSGLYFLHQLIKEGRYFFAFLTGFFFGLSYLARTQALVFIPVTAFIFLWLVYGKKLKLAPTAKFFALILLSFYLFALPYDLYCRGKDGIYGLRARQEFFKKIAEPQTGYWYIEERDLDKDAETLTNFRMARECSPLKYVLSDPEKYFKVVIIEYRHSAMAMLKDGMVINPLIVCSLLLLFLVVVFKRRPSDQISQFRVHWLWAFFFLVIPPLTAPSAARYYAVLTPILALYGAGGIVFLRDLFASSKYLRSLSAKPALALWILGLIFLFPQTRSRYFGSQPAVDANESNRVKTALWLKKTISEKGKLVMSMEPLAAMMSENNWYLMPADWPMRVVKYAKAQGVDYLLFEESLFSLTSSPLDWSNYFLTPSDKPGLKYVAGWPSGQEYPLAALYRVDKREPAQSRPPTWYS